MEDMKSSRKMKECNAWIEIQDPQSKHREESEDVGSFFHLCVQSIYCTRALERIVIWLYLAICCDLLKLRGELGKSQAHRGGAAANPSSCN